MPERVNPVEFTLIKRNADALSAIPRSMGALATLEVVVGLRVPDTGEVMMYGYTPTGAETEERTTWREDRAHKLHQYYVDNYADTGTTEVDCFDMVDHVMGWQEGDMLKFDPAPMQYYEARPGKPIVMTDGRVGVHMMMGVDRRGQSLAVLGKRETGGGFMGVASNRMQMRVYGGIALAEITDRPLAED